MNSARGENTVGWSEPFFMFWEELAQPGKDLVARVRQFAQDENGNNWRWRNTLPSYYRVDDIGCGMGFARCQLNPDPDKHGNLPRIAKDDGGHACIRVDDAFGVGQHWPTQDDDVLFACGYESRGEMWTDMRWVDPTDEGTCQATWPGYDVVISSSFLQWLDGHPQVIANLMETVSDGGYLCATLPRITTDERFQRMHFMPFEAYAGPGPDVSVAAHPGGPQQLHSLSAAEYAQVLAGLCDRFWVWETAYHPVIHGTHDLEEWYARSDVRNLATCIAQSSYSTASEADMKAELFKWLRAGNPQPLGDDMLLSYPFVSFIAEKG